MKNNFLFIILLLSATVLFRSPTLFVDYYDVDELSAIVQTQEYLAGDIPGVDFKESKLPVYHAIFKLAYKIDKEHGWVYVHLFTMLIIFFTGIFIFLCGRKVFNIEVGQLAALLYVILISSFNRHFMATNAEIVYNLPVIAGFFFFILFITNKKIIRYFYILLAISSSLIASQVKVHGAILLIFIAFVLLFYQFYYTKKADKKYWLIICILVIAGIIAFAVDFSITKKFIPQQFAQFKDMLFYAFISKGIHPLNTLAKFIHRQGFISLWHFILWIPAFCAILLFIKNRFRDNSYEKSLTYLFFIILYLMIFSGGSRLYFHYYMSCYPLLVIVASAALVYGITPYTKKLKSKVMILTLIPALFFLAWNYKDVIIKEKYPQAFYNEGKALYWTRAALIGTFNDYLLPDKSYIDACNYIKAATKEGERIVVWGDGPYLYYFSNRRIGINHIWPKGSIIKIVNFYKSGSQSDINAAVGNENWLIYQIQHKKSPVVLFIDTSENGLSTFNYTLEQAPVIKKFVTDNYSYETEINKIKIYRLKNYER